MFHLILPPAFHGLHNFKQNQQAHSTHLRFNVAMHHALGMNEVDGRPELSRDAARLSLRKLLLAANTIEQFAAGQSLHHNVHVKLTHNNRLNYYCRLTNYELLR